MLSNLCSNTPKNSDNELNTRLKRREVIICLKQVKRDVKSFCKKIAGRRNRFYKKRRLV